MCVFHHLLKVFTFPPKKDFLGEKEANNESLGNKCLPDVLFSPYVCSPQMSALLISSELSTHTQSSSEPGGFTGKAPRTNFRLPGTAPGRQLSPSFESALILSLLPWLTALLSCLPTSPASSQYQQCVSRRPLEAQGLGSWEGTWEVSTVIRVALSPLLVNQTFLRHEEWDHPG